MKVKVSNAHIKDSVTDYIDRSEAVSCNLDTKYSLDKYLVLEVESIDNLLEMIDYDRFIVSETTWSDEYEYSVEVYDYYVE